MRETIGSTWTFQLIFGFILLFVSFLTVTISYSKSFRIRNEMTSIIEKYGGFNAKSIGIINGYIKSVGYRNTGKCGSGDEILGIDNYENTKPRTSDYSDSKRYLYCVKKEKVDNGTVSDVYYEVILFYKFDLPIIGDISTFKVRGKTTDMTNAKNDLFSFSILGW